MVQFYHQNKIDMIKLECVLPNLANVCLHKSTNKKFYAFCESDGDFCEKIGEDLTGGPSIVFKRKAVSGTHQISANQSLELMRASSIPIQCVKICQQDCTKDFFYSGGGGVW